MTKKREVELLEAFLSLSDKVEDSEEVEEIAETIGLEVCSVCKDSDLPPSEYLKTKDQLKRNGWDESLNGKVCDVCLEEEEEFEKEEL
jgi:hypothetical protein